MKDEKERASALLLECGLSALAWRVEIVKQHLRASEDAAYEKARLAVCQFPGTDDEFPCPPCRRINALKSTSGEPRAAPSKTAPAR